MYWVQSSTGAQMSQAANSFNNHHLCPCLSTTLAAAACYYSRVIIKTDKSTIRTYKLRRVKCTRVNRRYSHRHVHYDRRCLWRVVIHLLHRNCVINCCHFIWLTALLIVVCLQWMAAKGREKKPWTSGDHGFDTACMQTTPSAFGRRRNTVALNIFPTFGKSTTDNRRWV